MERKGRHEKQNFFLAKTSENTLQEIIVQANKWPSLLFSSKKQEEEKIEGGGTIEEEEGGGTIEEEKWREQKFIQRKKRGDKFIRVVFFLVWFYDQFSRL